MPTIIITGATSGIGRATAKTFSEAGYTCILNSRTESDLEELSTELPGEHIVVPGDVGEEETAKKIAGAAREAEAPITLFNNAGFGEFKPIEDMSKESFESQFQTNVTGVFLVTKHVLPVLRKHGEGNIITTSSMAGKNVFANGTAYASTKWAVQGFMGCLKKEVRDTHIKVGTILPGSVDTAFFDDAPFGPTENRHLDAEDVAQTAWFLANQPRNADIDEITLRPAKRE